MTECADLAVPDYVTSSGDRVIVLGSEAVVRGFDFSKTREVEAGATLSSATVAATPAVGITLGTPSVASGIASFTVTPSTAGEYCIKCIATLSTGAKVVMCGRIVVVDC